jgi:hypothetical protein
VPAFWFSSAGPVLRCVRLTRTLEASKKGEKVVKSIRCYRQL